MTHRIQPPYKKALDREVEKVVIFFLKAQGEIANKLLHLRLRMRAIGPVSAMAVEEGEVKALRRLSSADPTTGAPASAEMVAVKPAATPPHTNVFHPRRTCVTMHGGINRKGNKRNASLKLTRHPPRTQHHTHRSVAGPCELTEEFQDICNQLVKLLRFIELNAEAVRKILKKHDRVLLRDDLMTGSYLTTRASRSPANHLRQMFHHNGISAIVSSLKVAIEEMPENCRSLQESFGA